MKDVVPQELVIDKRVQERMKVLFQGPRLWILTFSMLSEA